MQIGLNGEPRLFAEGKVVKSVDESVNNSAVLQNDDELFFPMDANSIYEFSYYLKTTSPTAAPDGQLAFTGPAGAIASIMSTLITAAGAGGVSGLTLGNATNFRIDAAANYGLICGRGLVTTTNAGNLQLQWAQNTPTVENTSVQAGSFIHWRKIV